MHTATLQARVSLPNSQAGRQRLRKAKVPGRLHFLSLSKSQFFHSENGVSLVTLSEESFLILRTLVSQGLC